ncbi:MAG: O-antigen polymerase [Cellvibrio sp.]
MLHPSGYGVVLRFVILIIGLSFLMAGFMSMRGGVSPVLLLWFVVTVIILSPYFFTRNLFNPLLIYAALMSLSVLDFALQDAIDSDMRYYLAIDDELVQALRLKALVIIGLWGLTCYIFFAAGFKLKLPMFSTIKKGINAQSTRKVLWLVVLITIFICVGGFLLAVKHVGGISQMLSGISDRSETFKGIGFLRNFAQFGTISAICLLILKKRCLAIFVVLFSFFATASFGGRAAAFIGVLIPFFFAYNYTVRRLPKVWIYSLALMAAIFVVGMERFKYANADFSVDRVKAISSLSRGMADIMPSMLHALDIGDLNYQYGRTFSNVFVVLIPRKIWPDKPEGLGEDALLGRALIGEEYWGLPPGPYGVGYLNFGSFGVVLLGAIAGLLSGALYKAYLSNVKEDTLSFLKILYPFVFLKFFEFFSTYSAMQIVFAFVVLYFIYKLSSLFSMLKLA